ncbi:MAG TPA: WYL domain-containing protein, partial [Ktedonobacteraceae bacterium]|nr:WYL domain-containing protein [Ktedonobacteraceae bacterium]
INENVSNNMNHAESRSQLLDQVERLLRMSHKPLSQAEIARSCGVNRSTISRLEQSLIKRGVPLRYDEQNHWYIDRSAYVTSIKLQLDEALSVYLACRLLVRYSDKPNQHIVVALEKMAVALDTISRPLGNHINNTTQALRSRLPATPSHHQQILETLGQAWMEGRVVDMQYRPLHAKQPFRHRFAPYFLEPSAIGFSTYAIGYSDPPGKLRTRKLERIESIVLTNETFEIPANFDAVKLLEGAWGIWFDEEDKPTPVTLRFSQKVERRVRESHWHPSERTEPQLDGTLLWHAEIDAVEEFIPWVRSWGIDCEVFEPAELRQQMSGEAYQQAQQYGWQVSKSTSSGNPIDHSLFDDIFGG